MVAFICRFAIVVITLSFILQVGLCNNLTNVTAIISPSPTLLLSTTMYVYYDEDSTEDPFSLWQMAWFGAAFWSGVLLFHIIIWKQCIDQCRASFCGYETKLKHGSQGNTHINQARKKIKLIIALMYNMSQNMLIKMYLKEGITMIIQSIHCINIPLNINIGFITDMRKKIVSVLNIWYLLIHKMNQYFIINIIY